MKTLKLAVVVSLILGTVPAMALTDKTGPRAPRPTKPTGELAKTQIQPVAAACGFNFEGLKSDRDVLVDRNSVQQNASGDAREARL
jgi:hypothetical protein